MKSVLSQALQSELDNTAPLTATFVLGGDEYKVGSRPLTPADFAAVNKSLPVNFQSDPTQFEGQIDLLIRKTRMVSDDDELTEQKAFSVADRPVLQRMKVDTVSGMFRDLFGDQIGDDLYDEDAVDKKVDDVKGE